MGRIKSLCKTPLVILLVTAMVAGGLFLGFPQDAVANGSYSTVTLGASADTYLRGGAANTNEGASPFLRVQGSGKNCVLVRFNQRDIEEAVAGGEILSAHLEMDVFEAKDNWGDGRTVDVHKLTMLWTEGNGKNAELPGAQSYKGDGAGATWNCAIDVDISNGNDDKNNGSVLWEMTPNKPDNPWIAAATDTVTITNDLLETVSWDVTTDVNAFINGEDNFGWIVKKTNAGANGHVKFASKENVEFSGPRLIITYAPIVREITLYSNKDSHLRQGAPNTNEGANPGLRIQASGNNRVVVGFDGLKEISTVGLRKATLVLTLMGNSDNWGKNDDRTVDAHRLLVDWFEGNGKNDELKAKETYRGDGPGVTWNCPVDAEIGNQKDDGDRWDMENPGKVNKQGGNFAVSTAAGVIHYNGLRGEVSWDVTQDVLDGAEFGWLIKKTNEGASGKVIYYSREGAEAAGNMDLAPRLLLEYGTPD